MHTDDRIRFDRFELRPAQRLLLHDGQPCRLGGRAFDVLLMLLENAHRTVGRAELFERVWPGLAVEPNNLQVQIWALRKLLGRKAILTVARRGYRYVGSIAEPVTGRLRVPQAGVEHHRSDASTAGMPPLPAEAGNLRVRLRWRSRRA
jgi:DNA-binding winged helix-turn-helix (wHTH) protein